MVLHGVLPTIYVRLSEGVAQTPATVFAVALRVALEADPTTAAAAAAAEQGGGGRGDGSGPAPHGVPLGIKCGSGGDGDGSTHHGWDVHSVARPNTLRIFVVAATLVVLRHTLLLSQKADVRNSQTTF